MRKWLCRKVCQELEISLTRCLATKQVLEKLCVTSPCPEVLDDSTVIPTSVEISYGISEFFLHPVSYLLLGNTRSERLPQKSNFSVPNIVVHASSEFSAPTSEVSPRLCSGNSAASHHDKNMNMTLWRQHQECFNFNTHTITVRFQTELYNSHESWSSVNLLSSM